MIGVPFYPYPSAYPNLNQKADYWGKLSWENKLSVKYHNSRTRYVKKCKIQKDLNKYH